MATPRKPYPGMGPFVVMCTTDDPYCGANTYGRARVRMREIAHYSQRFIASNLPGDPPNLHVDHASHVAHPPGEMED